MGLCDDSSAAALFRDLHGETVRKDPKATVTLWWTFVDRATEFRTVTEIKALKTFERVEQKLSQLKSAE